MTFVLLSLAVALLGNAPTAVRVGSSPQLAMDTRGIVRLIFGGKDVVVDARGVAMTAWRRDAIVYRTRANEQESRIGNGRSPMIARDGNAALIVRQDGPSIKLTSYASALEKAGQVRDQVFVSPGTGWQ